ncbi:MAG: type II toxin-antitoxin system VapB family antitoxin [Leptospiraceae bacterium]|nr:type II toxin-antitoxin system VapB family antitoxin [Leptospiraceae bacterium]
MRTTIIISDDLIKEAMQITGIAEKTKLIKYSLEEIIKRKAKEDLLKFAGTQKQLKPVKRTRG